MYSLTFPYSCLFMLLFIVIIITIIIKPIAPPNGIYSLLVSINDNDPLPSQL